MYFLWVLLRRSSRASGRRHCAGHSLGRHSGRLGVSRVRGNQGRLRHDRGRSLSAPSGGAFERRTVQGSAPRWRESVVERNKSVTAPRSQRRGQARSRRAMLRRRPADFDGDAFPIRLVALAELAAARVGPKHAAHDALPFNRRWLNRCKSLISTWWKFKKADASPDHVGRDSWDRIPTRAFSSSHQCRTYVLNLKMHYVRWRSSWNPR